MELSECSKYRLIRDLMQHKADEMNKSDDMMDGSKWYPIYLEENGYIAEMAQMTATEYAEYRNQLTVEKIREYAVDAAHQFDPIAC